jgi:hypothetical protein
MERDIFVTDGEMGMGWQILPLTGKLHACISKRE